MKLLRTTTWHWWDIGILKWCCLLFGMIAGAYLRDFVVQYVWVFLVVAVLLAIRPAIVYFRN